jgi:hypothetical protein
MSNLKVAFRNFAKAPKNGITSAVQVDKIFKMKD